MKRRRRILIAFSLLALVIVITSFLTDDGGPKYKGRSLKEWALIHERATGRESVHNSKYDPDMLRQSEAAILAIGTNALPWLMKWIQFELKPTPWRDKVANAIDKIPGELWDKPPLSAWLADPNWDHLQAAGIAFEILGSNATPVLPKLTNLLYRRNSSDVCGHAAHALACIGEMGVPTLLAEVEDLSFPHRIAVMRNLWHDDRWGTNSLRVKLFLAKSVRDSDKEVARQAADLLGRLAVEPEISIAALTNGLSDPRVEVREASVRSLCSIGKPAVAALTPLIVAMSDTNRDVREWATNAVRKIAPKTLSAESTFGGGVSD